MPLSPDPLPSPPQGFRPDRPAVVILHYGDPSRTARLHDQLLESDPDWRDNVLVLDNAAPQPYPASRTWHRAAGNGYWAGAFAACLEHLHRLGAERLWFMNNDIYFASAPAPLTAAWARLVRLEKTLGPVGLYSPAVLANPYHPQMVARPGAQASEVGVADGIAPLVSVGAVAEVGGLDADDNPFGYGVDLWLSLRLARAGYRLVVDHQVTIRHIYHTTARSIDGFLDRAAALERDYLAARLGPEYRREIDAAKGEVRDLKRL